MAHSLWQMKNNDYLLKDGRNAPWPSCDFNESETRIISIVFGFSSILFFLIPRSPHKMRRSQREYEFLEPKGTTTLGSLIPSEKDLDRMADNELDEESLSTTTIDINEIATSISDTF